MDINLTPPHPKVSQGEKCAENINAPPRHLKKKKTSIPVTVSYHIPSYPIICSTSILPWLPYTNHGSEQGANGRPVVQLGHPRSMRQGGSPNLGAAAMYWFHRCKSQKKKDGEVCHFSRFSKISKHHWFLPSFWSTSASLTKYAVF